MSNIHREDWYLGVDDEFDYGRPSRKGPSWIQNAINGPETYRDRKFQRRRKARHGRVEAPAPHRDGRRVRDSR
ncbi:hypothetical protein SEA_IWOKEUPLIKEDIS_80 [Mycobacterium phage Iwokeuplikedis]|nr:hypothetical protein SEA_IWOKEUPLIKEDIS_80 [Mycobacterium phage Iwokeuplikedis]